MALNAPNAQIPFANIVLLSNGLNHVASAVYLTQNWS